MAVKVNPPPQIKLPKSFNKDPEVREYFRRFDRMILQLWKRTGGGEDFISESRDDSTTQSNTPQLSGIKKDIQNLEKQQTSTNNAHLIQRIEELESANKRLESAPLLKRIEELESRSYARPTLIDHVEDTRYLPHVGALRAEIKEVPAGNVIGPSTSTDNAIARYNLTTGQLLQNSSVLIDDSNNITGVGSLDMTGIAANKLVVSSSNVASTPTISFGDGDTGFYEVADDELGVSVATNLVFKYTATSLEFSQNLTASDGKGLDFSAYTDGSVAGSTTSQILLDYEEGTFTPGLRGSVTSGDHTYTTQVGFYTKVGRLVTIHGRITVNSQGTLDGLVYITGFPYTSSSTANTNGTINFSHATSFNITATESLTANVQSNATEAIIKIWNSTAGATNMDDADLTDGADFYFMGQYIV